MNGRMLHLLIVKKLNAIEIFVNIFMIPHVSEKNVMILCSEIYFQRLKCQLFLIIIASICGLYG